MKKVTIVRPDGSKLILEGATPEEILKLSPAPVYYTYPSPPYWWYVPTFAANPAPIGPTWIGTTYVVNKGITSTAAGCAAGAAAAYTLTGASV